MAASVTFEVVDDGSLNPKATESKTSKTADELTPFVVLDDVKGAEMDEAGTIEVRADWWAEFAAAAPPAFVSHLSGRIRTVDSSKWAAAHAGQWHLPIVRVLYSAHQELHCFSAFASADTLLKSAVIPLANHDRLTLLSFARAATSDAKTPKTDVKSWLTAKFVSRIEAALDQCPDGVQVRTDHAGPSTTFVGPSLCTVDEVLRHLIGSAELCRDLQRDIHRQHNVVLSPWSRDDASASEVRVFLHRRRVTAISQKCVSRALSDCLRLDGVVTKLAAHVEADIGRRWSFGDAVVDVRVDGPADFHVVDVQPGGPWTKTTGVLFHLQKDRRILYPSASASPICVRLLDHTRSRPQTDASI